MPTLLPGQSVTAVASTSSATSAPSGATDPIVLQGTAEIARTLINYSGTVSACTLRLWLQDDQGNWFAGPSTDDLDALSPGGASAVDEVRDWIVGKEARLAVQVEAISGGGTVVVRVQGVGA